MSTSHNLFQSFSVHSHCLLEDQERLDASFYANEVSASRNIIVALKEKNIEVKKIADLAKKIFWPGRFKRRYASSKDGIPFVMPSDAFMFLPRPKKYVKDYPEDVLIDQNWLLITRSGSVGRSLLSSRILQNSIVSDDLIRLIPKKRNMVGYLYAYLNTWVGKAFLTKDKYGSTVKHLESHHVSAIPIPLISRLAEEANKRMLEAHRLKEKAQDLLLNAEEKIYSELGLPKIGEDDVAYFGGQEGKAVKAFGINARDISLRLDASYHIPLSHLALKYLLALRSGHIKRLHDIADSFVPPRFKRAYVKDASEGVPLLQGAHIPQIVPQDIKYIWKKMRNLDSYVVRKNWILLTCSGTIGRLALVSDHWDGWTATNHLLRIVPKQREIHPGYLTAFLLSIYGKVQIERLIYGGVVDEIGEAGNLLNDILIPKPIDSCLEKEIGDLTTKAYHIKDQANEIEANAVKSLELNLEELAK